MGELFRHILNGLSRQCRAGQGTRSFRRGFGARPPFPIRLSNSQDAISRTVILRCAPAWVRLEGWAACTQSIILRGSPSGASAPQGSHLRMTDSKCDSAFSRRGAPELCKSTALENQRAQGKPGARCTRSLAWCVKNTRVSHHRFTGTPGLPCAMVLTVSSALSPVTGLVCHRHPQEACFSRT
jgi:hypothetical protein